MTNRIEKIEAAAESMGQSHSDFAEMLISNINQMAGGRPSDYPGGCFASATRMMSDELGLPEDEDTTMALVEYITKHHDRGDGAFWGVMAAQLDKDMGDKVAHLDLDYTDHHVSKTQ
jgi:hypothetical protein